MSSANDLRKILFDTINDVRAGKVDKDQADMIAKLSQTVINTAKVEVEAARHGVGHYDSQFLPQYEEPSMEGVVGIKRHKLKG